MLCVDTTKMDTCGSDIVRLSKDLKDVIEDMFIEINNLSTKKIWNGRSADNFIFQCNKEKSEYIEFQENLRNYGVILKNNAAAFDEIIDKK